MIQEPFAIGSSPLHGLDPRVKIVAAVAVAVALSPAASMHAPLAALTAGAGLAAWARLPLGLLARRLAVINVFTAFLWVFLCFGVPGQPLFSLGSLTATVPGTRLALLITLKTNAVMLWFMALVATSDVASLGQALRCLGVSPKLVFMLLFTYRFAHVLGAELDRLRTAARLRCFTPRNTLHTYRTMASIMAMVLVGAMNRAEKSRMAMQLRGFQGSFATLRRFDFGADAKAFLIFAGIFVLCIVWLEVRHG